MEGMQEGFESEFGGQESDSGYEEGEFPNSPGSFDGSSQGGFPGGSGSGDSGDFQSRPSLKIGRSFQYPLSPPPQKTCERLPWAILECKVFHRSVEGCQVPLLPSFV